MKETTNENESNSISLCPAEPKDYEFLLKVFKEGRPELNFISNLSEEKKEDIIVEQFKIQQQQLARMYPKAEFYIVKLNDESVGRLYLHRGEANYRILEIGLLEQYRNQGIGRRTMKLIIENAIKERKNLSLQVIWFNNKAFLFYEKLGFKITENNNIFCEMQYII
ncbi:GNAT family N-acetyltransferase [Clostridium autoethanogenum]|uniref:GNAT family N-acetyltransferase n=1 Tax=Clostridium autoethanogenum DSM 10061 TaxID=1341692 RepID=A0ABN4BGC3_9CLOT|nr:GNAT family N-acetyltransferase [Clostridium autoethanogenum]AGY75266.1 GNAT family N-acetyltransferase [Clostridium autoethanogenum DSM 10061]ALU35434.1 GCN5-related N-acetyltransferase [Clostridium autoethanogenum DSM 10061]OVY49711.1 putative acetyltransferase [Clostridium autoethanogenum]